MQSHAQSRSAMMCYTLRFHPLSHSYCIESYTIIYDECADSLSAASTHAQGEHGDSKLADLTEPGDVLLLEMEMEQDVDMRGKHPLCCAYVGDTWIPALVTFSVGAAGLSPITVSQRVKFLGSEHTYSTYKNKGRSFTFLIASTQIVASLEVLVQRAADSAVVNLIIDRISDAPPVAASVPAAPAAVAPCCDEGLD
jgi:hypothetical protein